MIARIHQRRANAERGWWLGTLAVAIALAAGAGQPMETDRSEAPAQRRASDLVVDVDGGAPLLRQLIEFILREVVPRDYEDTKKWGTTKEVTNGLHIRTDGLKITTKRKKKTVKHGTWKRYHVTMVDPDETFQVRLRAPTRSDSGALSTELFLTARLNIDARLQEWQRDVRLLSVSAQARADVEVRIAGTVAIDLAPSTIAPSLMLRPHVQSAEVKLASFKLERVGKADGFVIRELVGDGIEPLLEELIRDKNEELVEKLNRQIQKNQDKLRLSLMDPMTRLWLRWYQEKS